MEDKPTLKPRSTLPEVWATIEAINRRCEALLDVWRAEDARIKDTLPIPEGVR